MGFLIALCATATVGFALLLRLDWLRARRRLAQHSPGGDGGDASSDGWSVVSWFTDGDSASSSYDGSGDPADAGSWGGSSDSGGGGDCGGDSSGSD
jgi:hypothetical protein